mmetsp:Transcript_16811/g.48843  ORF Transcript_16811/g.48843 Transcript_16811/m.48843 type:complete len:364 (+) Transcript_16811:1487-2578(+)
MGPPRRDDDARPLRGDILDDEPPRADRRAAAAAEAAAAEALATEGVQPDVEPQTDQKEGENADQHRGDHLHHHRHVDLAATEDQRGSERPARRAEAGAVHLLAGACDDDVAEPSPEVRRLVAEQRCRRIRLAPTQLIPPGMQHLVAQHPEVVGAPVLRGAALEEERRTALEGERLILTARKYERLDHFGHPILLTTTPLQPYAVLVAQAHPGDPGHGEIRPERHGDRRQEMRARECQETGLNSEVVQGRAVPADRGPAPTHPVDARRGVVQNKRAVHRDCAVQHELARGVTRTGLVLHGHPTFLQQRCGRRPWVRAVCEDVQELPPRRAADIDRPAASQLRDGAIRGAASAQGAIGRQRAADR